MVYLLVRHEVKDYARWKSIFDEHGAARQAAGSTGTNVYQDTENPNKISVIVEFPDLEHARAFTQSPDLRAAMERGGVMTQPEASFLNMADTQTA